MTDTPVSLNPLAKFKCFDPRFELYTNDQLFILTKDEADIDTEHSVKFMDSNNAYIDVSRGNKFTQLGSIKKPRPDRTAIEATDRWHFRVEGFIHDFSISENDQISLMLFKAFNTFDEDSLKDFAVKAGKNEAYYAVIVSAVPKGESDDRVIFGVIDTNKKNRYIIKGFDFNEEQTIPEIILDNTEEIAEFLARETFE